MTANLTSYRSTTLRGINPEFFKFVTLLAESQSEMQGVIKFDRKMNYGTKINKFCGEIKQVFCKKKKILFKEDSHSTCFQLLV